MSELENAWERIAAWYAQRDLSHLLRHPSPEHHIQKLENLTGLRLPEDMQQSFCICSGLADSPVQELLCPKRIYDEWSIWHENVVSGRLPYDDAELFEKGWNVNAWMPLTWDGGSNGFYINLDSEDSAFANVFYLDHEEGPQFKIPAPSQIVFTSFTQFVIFLASDLENGKFNPAEAPIVENEFENQCLWEE